MFCALRYGSMTEKARKLHCKNYIANEVNCYLKMKCVSFYFKVSKNRVCFVYVLLQDSNHTFVMLISFAFTPSSSLLSFNNYIIWFNDILFYNNQNTTQQNKRLWMKILRICYHTRTGLRTNTLK